MVYLEIYDIFMYPVLHSHLVENLEIRKERYWIHKDEIIDALEIEKEGKLKTGFTSANHSKSLIGLRVLLEFFRIRPKFCP